MKNSLVVDSQLLKAILNIKDQKSLSEKKLTLVFLPGKWMRTITELLPVEQPVVILPV